jgi:hypothetical protein
VGLSVNFPVIPVKSTNGRQPSPVYACQKMRGGSSQKLVQILSQYKVRPGPSGEVRMKRALT